MSYSHDGVQLGIVYSDTNSRVVFLDMTRGGIADKVDFAGKPPTASAYTGEAVEWLGDQGWCLFGGTVIDRKTRRVIWNLDLPITLRLCQRVTLPSGWLTQTGPYAQKKIKFVPFPAAEVKASLAALEGQASAHLRPGASVSLDISVGELLHGTVDDTRERLAGIFAERFQADEITIADGQAMTLKVQYNESKGHVLAEREGFSGPKTGRTVQATNSTIDMNLTTSDGSKAFFTHTIDYEPQHVTMFNTKEVNESTVRDRTFSHLLYRLSAAPIPYFVPTAEGMTQLPGVTKIE